MPVRWFATVLFCSALVAYDAVTAQALAQKATETVNIYTTRDRQLIEPMLRVFERMARFRLNVVHLPGPPQAQLKADAAAGKVDLFIAREFSQLVAAKSDGLTAPVAKGEFIGRVRDTYRDPEGHWFGLTARPRALAVSRERVQQKEITYEELAEPKWKGKICIGAGLHPYNLGLVSSMIAHHGEPFTETWLRGLRHNLAMKPTGTDRDQIPFVHAGRCDVALVNTNYVGALRAARGAPDSLSAGYAVTIVFPNARDRGAHVSLSGMSLIKNGPGQDKALLLMDFLTSEPAQFIYSEENHEYPTRPGVKPSKLVASWGSPRLDMTPHSKIAELQAQVASLVRKVRFDDGP